MAVATDRPVVVSVSAGRAHGPFKPVRACIDLVAGVGVAGDAHAGVTVQHRSRARAHPDWVNLRQVHLLAEELHDELRIRGFDIEAGQMGENILTRGLDLHELPAGTVLRIGQDAELEVTGLRNPCTQLDGVRLGLMAAVLGRAADGALERRAGVMAVVRAAGTIKPGDAMAADVPEPPHTALRPV